MSEPIIDHSDEIGRVKSLIILLNDFHPLGEWKDYPLLIKWQRFPYSLTRGEWCDLIAFLEKNWEEFKPKGNKPVYVQQDLFE